MTDPINPISPLIAPNVQPYQSYLPTAFSDDLSLLQKVNYLISYLGTVTTTVNNAVATVNGFSSEIDADVINQLTTWNTDGTLGQLLSSYLNELTTKKSHVLPEVFGADPSATASTNRSAIQQALDTGGSVFLGTPGTYQIDTTLLIGDNTSFELGLGVTIQLANAVNKPLLQNKGYTANTRNTNITIKGGTWDYNGLNQTATGLNTMGLLLKGVDHLTIEEASFKNTLKYCILIADATEVTTNNLYFNTTSDGLHLQGPITNADLRTLKGTTGDDMVSLTIGDYSAYQLTSGNFKNIVIDGLYPENSLTAVKISGNPSYSFDGMVIRNVQGTVQNQGIYIENDTNLLQTVIGKLLIDNIDLVSANSKAIINVDNGSSQYPITIDDLTITNVKYDGTFSVARLNNYITVGKLKISNLRAYAGAVDYLIGLDSSCSVKALYIDDIHAKLGSSSVAGYLVYTECPIDLVSIKNVDVNLTFSGSKVYWHRQGLVNVITMQDIFANGSNGGDSVYSQDINVPSGCNVSLLNINAKAISQLAYLTQTTNLFLDKLITSGLGYLVSVNAASGITPRILSGKIVSDTNDYLNLTGGCSASANGMDFKTDLSKLTKVNYDQVYNINSSLACGTGLAITNGSNWKNLYSGTTY